MKKDWIYYGDFDVKESMIMDGKFIKDKIPNIIFGYFNCNSLKLKSLKDSPKEVNGHFYCYNNNLISLIGISKKIEGSLDLTDNQLTSLKGSPKKIKGNFYCHTNKLTSLIGGPDVIEGYFDCSHNQLLSLEGGPEEVEYIFSDLKIEEDFINSKSYINNYFKDLLKYMIKEKIALTKVLGWPEEFKKENYNIFKSSKGLSKFNL